MSVEQSGHQPWLSEAQTSPLDEPDFNVFTEHTLTTPPVEPAVAVPYQTPSRRHTPSWARTELVVDDSAFTAPLHTLEPAFGTPVYADILTERTPNTHHVPAQPIDTESVTTGFRVMSLQQRGPIVKDGEQGSIFATMNRERAASGKDYAELRRPYYGTATVFERTKNTPQMPSAPEQPAPIAIPATAEVAVPAESALELRHVPAPKVPELAAAPVHPVSLEKPQDTRTITTVIKGEKGTVAAVIEEEQSGLDSHKAAALLTRVLRGLEKSRDEDIAAEAAIAAETQAKALAELKAEEARQAKADAEAAQAETARIASEEEQLARDIAIFDNEAPQQPVTEAPKTQPERPIPAVVREERLTLSGLREAAREVMANHKKATRIAEYAGAAVVAVAAGRRLLGRLRRR